MKPLFSIIVPVYNVASYLRECLDSMLAQTYSNWECLCVDDGSMDESGAILDEYVQKDSRFRVFHKRNGGVSAARNLALNYMRGEWICFLDSDDMWDASFLLEMKRQIEKEKPDLLHFNFIQFHSTEMQIPTIGEKYHYVILSNRSKIREWAVETLPRNGCCWSSVIQKKYLERFPEGVAVAEDTLFMLRVANRLNKVVLSSYSGYFYRETNGSATTRRFSSRERLQFLQEFKQVVQLYRIAHRELSWLAWFNLCGWCLRPKDLEFRNELHRMFKQLVKEQKVMLSGIPIFARPAFLIYVHMGWIWSIQLTYGLIAFLNDIKSCCRR